MSEPSVNGDHFARDRRLHPPAFTPGYKSSFARSPRHAPLSIQGSLSETTGPTFGHADLGPLDNDLLRNHGTGGDPIGERIIVHGHVRDQDGRASSHTLVELWQANAGGRYRHAKDGYLAPLDPHFGGCGRCLTDERGYYAFRTVKPGAYPFRNHVDSWRMAHIHFSVFGRGFAQRLVTQMYFEGDPLIPHCPIVQGIPSEDAIERLTAALDLNATIPLDSIAYRFDVVLRGRRRSIFQGEA